MAENVDFIVNVPGFVLVGSRRSGVSAEHELETPRMRRLQDRKVQAVSPRGCARWAVVAEKVEESRTPRIPLRKSSSLRRNASSRSALTAAAFPFARFGGEG